MKKKKNKKPKTRGRRAGSSLTPVPQTPRPRLAQRRGAGRRSDHDRVSTGEQWPRSEADAEIIAPMVPPPPMVAPTPDSEMRPPVDAMMLPL